MQSNAESAHSSRSCFAGLFSSVLRNSENSLGNTGDAGRDLLLVSLLQLVETLIQVEVPDQGGNRRNSRSQAESGSRTPTNTQSPHTSSLTDATKLASQAAGTGRRNSETLPVTDEEKTENASNSQPRSCSHFTDIRDDAWSAKSPRLADLVLGHAGVMRHLVEALSCCNSNTMAMILGSSGLPATLQDSMAGNRYEKTKK